MANLTLMALGSSAPEILLSVIEVIGNSFYTGELGPSTIVGSAAFNLMCISAVCVSAYVYSNSKLERILFLISNCFLIVCCLFEHHLQNNSAILGTKSKDI